jgi:hypothetical protein
MEFNIEDSIANLSGIYKITDNVSGKFYIGSAKNLFLRYRTHIQNLNTNTHHNKHLQSIYNLRKDKLIFTLEIVTTLEYLSKIEQKYLTENRTNEKCINATFTVNRAPSHHELPIDIQKRKIEKRKKTMLQRYNITGVLVTPEGKKQSQEKRKGIKRSPEANQKMLETKRKNNTLLVPHNKLKGRKNPNHSKIMKERFKEGRLKHLTLTNRKDTSNGNFKGTVNMENINTLEITSLSRKEWNNIYGINAPKMARLTNNIQKNVIDKFNNVWKLYDFMY